MIIKSAEGTRDALCEMLRRQINELNDFSENISNSHGHIDPETFKITVSLAEVALKQAKQLNESLNVAKGISLIRMVPK